MSLYCFVKRFFLRLDHGIAHLGFHFLFEKSVFLVGFKALLDMYSLDYMYSLGQKKNASLCSSMCLQVSGLFGAPRSKYALDRSNDVRLPLFFPEKCHIYDAHRLNNITLLTLVQATTVHCSSKGSRRPTSLMRTHHPQYARSEFVSHTACKDEFRQKLWSHSWWSVFLFLYHVIYDDTTSCCTALWIRGRVWG